MSSFGSSIRPVRLAVTRMNSQGTCEHVSGWTDYCPRSDVREVTLLMCSNALRVCARDSPGSLWQYFVFQASLHTLVHGYSLVLDEKIS